MVKNTAEILASDSQANIVKTSFCNQGAMLKSREFIHLLAEWLRFFLFFLDVSMLKEIRLKQIAQCFLKCYLLHLFHMMGDIYYVNKESILPVQVCPLQLPAEPLVKCNGNLYFPVPGLNKERVLEQGLCKVYSSSSTALLNRDWVVLCPVRSLKFAGSRVSRKTM